MKIYEQTLNSILPVLLLTEIPIYFFAFLDLLKLRCLEKYRIHYSGQKKLRPYPTVTKMWECFKIHFRNFFGAYIIPSYLLIYFANKWDYNPYRTGYISWNMLFIEAGFISIIADFAFYWLHRLMHVGYFYNKMHHVHHSGLNYTLSLAHHVMDFKEALLFALPQALPPLILNSHITSMKVAFAWTQINTILGHSGYHFPFMDKAPFLSSKYHDVHHHRFNYNYGAIYPIIDKIFGTYLDPPLVSFSKPRSI